jgi:hypothetical protein
MMALIRAAFRAMKAGLFWLAEFVWECAIMPLRLFAPPSGRSSIPSAPRIQRPDMTQTTAQSVASPANSALRDAAAVIGWLSLRQRQGVAMAGELSTALSAPVRKWAYSLDDDQARHAIRSGFAGVSAHIAGRARIAGLPLVVTAASRSSEPRATRVKAASHKARQGFVRAEIDDDQTCAPASLSR